MEARSLVHKRSSLIAHENEKGTCFSLLSLTENLQSQKYRQRLFSSADLCYSDMDDENDIYNQFIHDKTENMVTKLNELYPGKVKLEVDGVCDFVGIADGEKNVFYI